MAEQMGMFPLQGTIGNINFYKSGDSYRARRKGGPTAQQIATDPQFQRSRENASEFAVAAKAGKLLRLAFNSFLKPVADERAMSRLAGTMVKVLQSDKKNARGKRKVVEGDLELLNGFEFNEQGKLSTTFAAPYHCNINRVTGELKITVPPFVPEELIKAPGGATHFKLVSGGAEVDFENKSFNAYLHSSLELPLNKVNTEEHVFNNTVPTTSTHPWILVMGIQFFQEVNALMYPLNNGNCLAIISVSGN